MEKHEGLEAHPVAAGVAREEIHAQGHGSVAQQGQQRRHQEGHGVKPGKSPGQVPEVHAPEGVEQAGRYEAQTQGHADGFLHEHFGVLLFPANG